MQRGLAPVRARLIHWRRWLLPALLAVALIVAVVFAVLTVMLDRAAIRWLTELEVAQADIAALEDELGALRHELDEALALADERANEAAEAERRADDAEARAEAAERTPRATPTPAPTPEPTPPPTPTPAPVAELPTREAIAAVVESELEFHIDDVQSVEVAADRLFVEYGDGNWVEDILRQNQYQAVRAIARHYDGRGVSLPVLVVRSNSALGDGSLESTTTPDQLRRMLDLEMSETDWNNEAQFTVTGTLY